MLNPSRNLRKVAASLFADLEQQEIFVRNLSRPGREEVALLWLRERVEDPFNSKPPFSWQPPFVTRVDRNEQPGKHLLHAEGAFYCLDMASVFMAMPFLNIERNLQCVVDVCASPGGKSLLAWKFLQPELLIANENIGKRTAALISNIKRCQIDSCVVTNNDSKILGEALETCADLVIVDAPCSGQSLMAKGEKTASCFHPVTINKCAMRQRRIIANSAQMVAPGGFLVYMTCTFSREENEDILEWFLKKHSDFQACEVLSLAGFESDLADFPCYRLWPQRLEGAGGFTSLLQRSVGFERGESNLSALRICLDRR
ncbi:MAG: RsmB/NOP family class I SAM-dependent RNA methyltransferase [SAR324 cluster bacterium]|uniref:RsmB/NOP family class I SAM-dependent RNA methyltransferase n=1 Tax=SAR324 cluster bacterium TaxID=2024889 RepID=A0A7X9FSU7_9DELT|nr:RsmB/NOP family class I SAM-dependent RNA methyltransferase [SAR324 cluster bacterium]